MNPSNIRFHAISCRDAVSVMTPSRSMTTASKAVRESSTTAFTATSALGRTPVGTRAYLTLPAAGPAHKINTPAPFISRSAALSVACHPQSLTPCLSPIQLTREQRASDVLDVEALGLGGCFEAEPVSNFCSSFGSRTWQMADLFDPGVEGRHKLGVLSSAQLPEPFTNADGLRPVACALSEGILPGERPGHRDRVCRSADDDQIDWFGDLRRRLGHLDQLDVDMLGQAVGVRLGNLLGVAEHGLIDDKSFHHFSPFYRCSRLRHQLSGGCERSGTEWSADLRRSATTAIGDDSGQCC